MLIGGTKLGDWWYRESLLLTQDNVVKEVVTAPGRTKRISWPTDLTPVLVGCDVNEPTTLEYRRDEIGHLAPMRWIEHLSIFI